MGHLITISLWQVAKSARTKNQYFRVLSTDIAYPILELAEDIVGWSPGESGVTELCEDTDSVRIGGVTPVSQRSPNCVRTS